MPPLQELVPNIYITLTEGAISPPSLPANLALAQNPQKLIVPINSYITHWPPQYKHVMEEILDEIHELE